MFLDLMHILFLELDMDLDLVHNTSLDLVHNIFLDLNLVRNIDVVHDQNDGSKECSQCSRSMA